VKGIFLQRTLKRKSLYYSTSHSGLTGVDKEGEYFTDEDSVDGMAFDPEKMMI
jgi:hypothetical protein